MVSTLRSLVDVISRRVDALEADCEKHVIAVPSLDETYSPELDLPRDDPEILKSTNFIIAAALQLVQTLRSPQLTLQHLGGGVRIN